MSVVLAYANEDMAIVSGDGRVSDVFGNVLSEEYRKVRQVNKNVIIGYAGAAIPCNHIADLITSPETTDLTQDARVEDVVISIEKKFSIFPPGLNIGFVICGIGENGKICGAIMAAGQEMRLYPATNESPFFCALYPNDIPRDTTIFEDQLLKKEPLPAIMETIKICSKLSRTINSRIYYEQISLKCQAGHP